MTNQNIKNGMALYVHIPFCEQKCNYCAFVSYASLKHEDAYFLSLHEEIKQTPNQMKNDNIITSIYFGGGTPTAVQTKHITQTLKLIRKTFVLAPDCEISIECNPSSTTKAKLRAFFKAGFNRTSFGVQTFVEHELKAINRLHSRKQAERAVKWASEVGFLKLSIDLLIGIPHQTKQSILETMDVALSLPVQHISAYSLILEENTPLHAMVNANTVQLPTEDECVDMILLLERRLKKHGFFKYEVSSFCKPGYECKQNLTYWECAPYLGFGIGAHGFVYNQRYENQTTFTKYLENEWLKNKHEVTKEEAIEERIMLGLRMAKGIDLKRFESDFGFSLLSAKQTEINMLLKQKFLKVTKNRLMLTNKGFLMLNSIVLKLI